MRARVTADPAKERRYHRLARGPYFAPVVEVARAYLVAAITNPTATEGTHWALSCLPGTTPRRLSALTMRITDMLVIYTSGPPEDVHVDALAIVERSTLEAGFGTREAARERYPRVEFTDSTYHGAGIDQMMVSGAYEQVVEALRDEVVAEAARALADRMMAKGRVMHWRGHNPLLAEHALHPGRPA